MTDYGDQRVSWQSCVIVGIVQRTPTIKSFFLRLSRSFVHIAGQHVDVKLTAPDGYSAMRSYSIASAANASSIIEIAIELLPDGEVSSFFHDVAAVGDEIELRGPLGGHFLWPEPAADAVPTALLLSARTAKDVLFSEELHSIESSDPAFLMALAITRERPARGSDYGRRVDGAMVQEILTRLDRMPTHVFVCGSNGFVNIATDAVLLAGVDASSVRTERYGG